jgi:hypothetical protein
MDSASGVAVCVGGSGVAEGGSLVAVGKTGDGPQATRVKSKAASKRTGDALDFTVPPNLGPSITPPSGGRRLIEAMVAEQPPSRHFLP